VNKARPIIAGSIAVEDRLSERRALLGNLPAKGLDLFLDSWLVVGAQTAQTVLAEGQLHEQSQTARLFPISGAQG
jgi:hypothetical protein